MWGAEWRQTFPHETEKKKPERATTDEGISMSCCAREGESVNWVSEMMLRYSTEDKTDPEGTKGGKVEVEVEEAELVKMLRESQVGEL